MKSSLQVIHYQLSALQLAHKIHLPYDRSQNSLVVHQLSVFNNVSLFLATTWSTYLGATRQTPGGVSDSQAPRPVKGLGSGSNYLVTSTWWSIATVRAKGKICTGLPHGVEQLWFSLFSIGMRPDCLQETMLVGGR